MTACVLCDRPTVDGRLCATHAGRIAAARAAAGRSGPRRGRRRRDEYDRGIPDSHLRLGLHADGTLDVACWCEAIIVRVPRVDVMAALTRSCGRPDCDQIDQARRSAAA